MAKTILELYEEQKAGGWEEGKPAAALVDAEKAKDKTKYSVGIDFSGTKDADDKAIAAFEKISPAGNKYGLAGADIGGGSSYLKNGYNDTKPYGKLDRAK
jgi:hypothetical protein